MQNTIVPIPVSSDGLPRKANSKLSKLPGAKGHWFTGNLKSLLPNPGPFLLEQRKTHGDCYTLGFFRNRRAVFLAGAAANELVLQDRDNNFSSRWGWEVVHAFFGNNILVRDFEDHRRHRKLMTSLFKPKALEGYLAQMRPVIVDTIATFDGPVDVYRQSKQMVLDIAIETFAGVPRSKDTIEWNKDLDLVLSNVMSHRIQLPGTAFSKAIKARNRLRSRLHDELPNRRKRDGADLFSTLARQRDESGAKLSDDDIVDHMFGIMFAAHDTTASALGFIFWLLAKHPDWQDEIRRECRALYARKNGKPLNYGDLGELPKVEWVFKETLRLYSPIQIIPRRNIRTFEFAGHRIPANTMVFLPLQTVHFDPRHYPNPNEFRPERFSTPHKTDPGLNPFAFMPFGRGSHMCLGMHFAYMEIKAVLYHTLINKVLEPGEDPSPDFEYLPLVRPTGPLIVKFCPIV